MFSLSLSELLRSFSVLLESVVPIKREPRLSLSVLFFLFFFLMFLCRVSRGRNLRDEGIKGDEGSVLTVFS